MFGLISWIWRVWFHVWEESCSARLLMTEFERPGVTLCGWENVKIQLLSNSLGTLHNSCPQNWLLLERNDTRTRYRRSDDIRTIWSRWDDCKMTTRLLKVKSYPLICGQVGVSSATKDLNWARCGTETGSALATAASTLNTPAPTN